VDPRAVLDESGRARLHGDSIPGPSSLYRVNYPGLLSISYSIIDGGSKYFSVLIWIILRN
jgi:hypothetical protein